LPTQKSNDVISVSSVRRIYSFYYTAQYKNYSRPMSIQFDGHSQTPMIAKLHTAAGAAAR